MTTRTGRPPAITRVTVLVLLALTAACSRAAEGDAAAPVPTTTAPTVDEAVTTTTAAPTVTLPDPGVAPGSCGLVTVTPPGSLDPQQADLCRPATDARDVGIVLVHGGGGIGGNRTGVVGWALLYQLAGYTTLAVDYHLFSPGGAESPVFPLPEQNVKASVQWLRASAPALGLDPERIALHGISAGARLGAVAFTTPGDPAFAGPELWPEVPDHVNAFIGFYSTYDGTMQYDRQYYGGPRDDPDPSVRQAWRSADSVVNALHATGPAVFYTGSLDFADIATQQEDFAERVREAGFQATTHVVEGAEHGFDSTETGLTRDGQAAAALLVGWLDRVFPQD